MLRCGSRVAARMAPNMPPQALGRRPDSLWGSLMCIWSDSMGLDAHFYACAAFGGGA